MCLLKAFEELQICSWGLLVALNLPLGPQPSADSCRRMVNSSQNGLCSVMTVICFKTCGPDQAA